MRWKNETGKGCEEARSCLSSQTLNHKRVQKLSGFVRHRQQNKDVVQCSTKCSPDSSFHELCDCSVLERRMLSVSATNYYELQMVMKERKGCSQLHSF